MTQINKTVLNNIQNSFGIDIQKGKSYPEGTIRNWNGKNFQKKNGEWHEVKKQGQKTNPDVKDETRVKGILERAKGDVNKAGSLAANMANAIKDEEKLLKRSQAAIDMYGEDHPISQAFISAVDAKHADEKVEDVKPKTEEKTNVQKEEKVEDQKEESSEISIDDVNKAWYEKDLKKQEAFEKKNGYWKAPPKSTQQELFWKAEKKDRYSPIHRMSEDEIENLKDVIGDGEGIWALVRKENKRTSDWINTVKVEDVESKWENDTPGYVGRMSGDVIAEKKGSITLGGKTYTRNFTKRYDTRGFW